MTTMTRDAGLKSTLQSLRLELGTRTTQQLRVFLDTKFWILLRDAESGTDALELKSILSDAASADKLVCPLEQYLFVELLNQRDPAKRERLIPLVDELTRGGVCLLPPHERVFVEVAEFMRAVMNPAFDPGSSVAPVEWMWTKIAHVLGFSQLTLRNASEMARHSFEAFSMNRLWTMNLSDMLAEVGDTPVDAMPWSESADLLNNNKRNEALLFTDKQELYLSEIRGCFDAYADSLKGVWEVLYTDFSGQPLPEGAGAQGSSTLASFLTKVFRERTEIARRLMPTCHIAASIYTAMQWDRHRRYQQNDFADFGHAAGAVGYGNIFLTERSLRTLLNNTKLSTQFGVQVVSSVREAIETISASLVRTG
jgi:hypothetical protein